MKRWHQHGGESKLPGLHPFEGEQLVRDILQIASRSLHEQDFDPMIILAVEHEAS